MDVTSVGYSGQILAAVPDTPSPKWLAENRELIRSVQSIDAAELFGAGHKLTFAMDPEAKRPVVRIVNQQTQEILWQAPPEYVLRMAAFLNQQDRLASQAQAGEDALHGYGK